MFNVLKFCLIFNSFFLCVFVMCRREVKSCQVLEELPASLLVIEKLID